MDERNQLLLMVLVHLLRGPHQPLDGRVEQMEWYLHRLRTHYTAAGSRYGDDDPGFQRWLLDQWPAPSMA